MKTILSIASARPNFVKLAAVHHALAAHPNDFAHVIVHTGQHYDPLLSDIFFTQLAIPQPDHNLGIKGGSDREAVIQATEDALLPVLQKICPDVVLVYGDVNGAVGGARAAKKLGIPLAHIEAGLRSFDLSMPEEHNRIAIDALADLLFCSEESGVEHLKSEVAKGQIHLVGNTMIDTLVRMMPLIQKEQMPMSFSEPFGVVTLHRPSNVDDEATLRSVLSFLGEVAASLPLILPAHHRLRASLDQFGIVVPEGIRLINPLGYLSFLRMLKESACVITDSGGIQEEAVYLQKRCFTLRRNTERPSTIVSGSNVLIDPDNLSDRKAVIVFAKNPHTPPVTVPLLWDGRAGERIAEVLRRFIPLS